MMIKLRVDLTMVKTQFLKQSIESDIPPHIPAVRNINDTLKKINAKFLPENVF